MTDVEALVRFSHGQQLDHATVERLVHAGLANAADGTNFDSEKQELLFTSITEKGRRHLQDALKVVDQHISDLKKRSPCDQEKLDNLTIARHSIQVALR